MAQAVTQRAVRNAGRALKTRSFGPLVDMRESLDGCLPIVAKTAKFFAAIPVNAAKYESLRQRAEQRCEPFWSANEYAIPPRITGRFNSFGDGRLTIAATLTRIDWILRFHDALLRAMVDRGCKVLSRKGLGSESYWVEVRRDRGVLIVSFAEDFEKSTAPVGRWDKSFPDTGYRAKDTMSLKVRWEPGAEKRWSGTPAQLEASLPNIVWDLDAAVGRADANIPALLADRAAERTRMEVEREEEVARREGERLVRARLAKEKAWVDQALTAGDAELRQAATLRVLHELEARAPEGAAGDYVREWIRVVSSRLTSATNALMQALLRDFTSRGTSRLHIGAIVARQNGWKSMSAGDRGHQGQVLSFARMRSATRR